MRGAAHDGGTGSAATRPQSDRHARESETKMGNILHSLRRFLRAGNAVSALEYVILVGVVVAGVGGALIAFSDSTETALTNIGEVKNVQMAAPKLNN